MKFDDRNISRKCAHFTDLLRPIASAAHALGTSLPLATSGSFAPQFSLSRRFQAGFRTVARRFIEFLCLAGLLIPVAAFGQVVTASLQGTVQDSTLAPISSASVRVVNLSTRAASNTVTNAQGIFAFPSLPLGGPYTITVESPSFKTEVQSGIFLAVNQHAVVNMVLQVGDITERVEVKADVMQLQTADSELGQVIPNRSILDLPLNERNVYSLMFLAPGTTGTVTDQFNGMNLSVNGGRPGSSDILIDGIPSSPPLVNPIQGFSAFPSVEAVQEFKMQTDNYSAEFGRSGSGIVNIILKSGTNQFNGSAYDFLRNSDLDCNSYFNNLHNVPLPNFKRNQFGFSLGGPVEFPKLYNGKDKTFFFFSYEGLRQGAGAELTASVPTQLQRTGDFSQTVNSAGQPVIIYDPKTTTSNGTGGYTRKPFPNNKLTYMDPVAQKIVNYYPLPTPGAGTISGQNNFFAATTAILNIDTYDAKVDQVFNEHNRMFVRYSRRNFLKPPTVYFPAAQAVAQGGTDASSQPETSNSAAVDYTLTASPTYVMEFRYGFARMHLDWKAGSTGFDPSAQLGFPSYISSNADHLLFPRFTVNNYYTLGDGGPGISKTSAFESHLLSVSNTKVIRNHVIKFGGEFRVLLVNDDESGASTGDYTFTQAITQGPNPNVATSTAGNAIASLLIGVGSGTYQIDSKNVATASKYYSAFVQDAWRLNSRLTLNGGIRYDLDIPRTERYNHMETFNPLEPGVGGYAGGVTFVGVNGNSRRQFNPQWVNLSPRLGFAYRLGNNSVVRGAYGIFYGPSMRAAAGTVGTEGFSSSTTYAGSPNGLTPSIYLSNPFPSGLNPITGSSLGASSGIGTSFENSLYGDNKVGYTESWNLDFQRQFRYELLVDAAYVGSHGVHLNKSGENDWNANQLSTTALALGTGLQQNVSNPFYGIIATGPESGPTIAQSYLEAAFPQFVAVNMSYLGGGYEDYNSFQLKVNKRVSQGLSGLVSYTYQTQYDDYSAISNVGHFGAGIQDIFNSAAERSLSPNNISQQFVASAVYVLPFGRKQRWGAQWNHPVNAVLGGWQTNAIVTEQNGYPLSISTQNTSHAGGNILRPNTTGVSPIIGGSIESRRNGYLNAAAFSQPAPFTFGNAPRTLSNVRAPGMHNIDFSLFKNFAITERMTAEFRAESFNVLNQVVFGGPNQVLTSGQFGVISTQANTPRQIQFALKLLW